MTKNEIKVKLVVGVAVVLMMIGVLFALPTLVYPAYAERAFRIEALDGMSRIRLAQDRFRLRNGTYTNDLSALGFDGGCTENCVYLASIEGADTETFRVRFVPNPVGGTNGRNQSGDESCRWYMIDALGHRTAENQNCLEGR